MRYTLDKLAAAIRTNEHPSTGDTVVAWNGDSGWLIGFAIGKFIGIDDNKYVVKTEYVHTPIIEYDYAVRIGKCNDVRPPINYEEGA